MVSMKRGMTKIRESLPETRLHEADRTLHRWIAKIALCSVALMIGIQGSVDAAPTKQANVAKTVKVAKVVRAQSAPTVSTPPNASGIAPPKLVLFIAVDGLPQEQLLKNYDLFVEGGFRRLFRSAWFTDAHQGHALTVTAVGHAAMLSGAYPYQHGIIGNEWRDRAGKYMYCVGDDAHKYLDGSPTTEEDGTSPKNLQVTTLGDEMRYASNDQSRVFAVSGKDRGSILLAGKTGTAYMYMGQTGNFSSTTYYMKKHPDWVEKYYAKKPQDRYFKQTWTPLLPASAYARSVPDGQAYATSYKQLPTRFGMQYGLAMEAPNSIYYQQLLGGPFGDELTADFATALMQNESLGKNSTGATDLLGVSFSSHDYINHNFGPESIQSQDHLIRLDRTLADFFAKVDKQVGTGNVLIVLTADHGFMNAPEYSRARQFEAGRIDSAEMRAAVNKALEAKFALPKLVTQSYTGGVTLDYVAAESKNISREALEDAAMRALLAFPGINYAFTRTQLERGDMPRTRVGLLAQRTWNRHSSVDIVVIQKPFHYFQSKTTKSPTACSHGTPYAYDTNVPLMMDGARWIKPGRYTNAAEVVDIAPTLSTILNIRPPSASEGRVLTEALVGVK
jgi:predicted AlkP superfamily pyrophosphatase or phosphodiesterase